MWWRNASRVDPDAPIVGNGDGRLVGVSAADVVEAARQRDAPTASETAPLTSGRSRLSEEIAALSAAREALEVASQPVQRLQGIVTELDHAEHDLATIDREHDRVVGE